LIVLLSTVLAVVAVRGDERVTKVEGYAEWRRGDVLIVDGQRLRVQPSTRFKGKGITGLDAIPLGFEVEAQGLRQPDGVVVVTVLEAKKNGSAMFEKEVRKATDEIEAMWLQDGSMYEPGESGRRQEIGKILQEGPTVDRVRRLMARLRPPYVQEDAVRVRVVDTKEWNAAAMGNGAVWVYTGLADEMSDDELAIVLGHELAHYTHEHSRRNAKKAMWGQIIAASAVAAVEEIDNGAARTAAGFAALISLTAWQSGYSRDLEDQADRVGLRYAHEGGFDVKNGPRLWSRFRDKYGERDKVTNFFLGSHSRPSDRIKNIERELDINYRPMP
jgi:Zn-dependent protease with chaperone function